MLRMGTQCVIKGWRDDDDDDDADGDDDDGDDGDDGGGDGDDVGVDRRNKLLPTLVCPNVPTLRLVVLFQMFPMLPLMAFSMSPPCCSFFFFNVTTLLQGACTIFQCSMLQVAKEILESFKSFSLLGSTSHPPPPPPVPKVTFPPRSQTHPLTRCSSLAKTLLLTSNTLDLPCLNLKLVSP